MVLRSGAVEWWLQKREGPQLHETIPTSNLGSFFEERRSDFAPDRVFRAKTRGLFQPDQQLTFVDAGLMPMVEDEIGQRLSELMGRVVTKMLSDLAQSAPSANTASRVFRSAFWLLAGKMLRDKRVPSFKTLKIKDVDDVFRRVGRHYGMPGGLPPSGARWDKALANAVEEFAAFAPLGNVTTESLADLWEKALVPKQVRKALGIHKTPSYLVDYMVWQMADWIEALPVKERHVFEPACGHGGFLVASVRLLRELLGDVDAEERKRYLRSHVHGMEIDEFAIEIARLSVSLADIPNPNGWDLQQGDMFASDVLNREVARAGIILANPPFEKFAPEDRQRYARQGYPTSQVNKAAELVARILPVMQPNSVLGLVMPQGLLHSKGAEDVRATLLRDFEIREVCLFPDKVFAFADSESAVLLARRSEVSAAHRGSISFRAVREPDWSDFQSAYRVTWARTVPAKRFAGHPLHSLRLPKLDEVWGWLGSLPRLSSIAEVGQGLVFHRRHLPRDIEPFSKRERVGDVPGFGKVPRRWMIHELPPRVWMTTNREAIRRLLSGGYTGEPQLIVNYHPVSRGPWRLKGAIDSEGHAITSSFLAVRALEAQLTPQFLWAICNSPVTNAFIYSHSLKRNILAGELRQVPVPTTTPSGVERVARAAAEYLTHMARSGLPLQAEPDMARAKHLLLTMDAEVLRLYDLPPRLERQLLDLFEGHQRSGVPFTFTSYYPPGFRPFLPLHLLLSEDYERTTAARLRARASPENSATVLTALSTAVESFKED
ncbi:MAG: N-6 DNA methylase [Planctomycetota bacterium]